MITVLTRAVALAFKCSCYICLSAPSSALRRREELYLQWLPIDYRSIRNTVEVLYSLSCTSLLPTATTSACPTSWIFEHSSKYFVHRLCKLPFFDINRPFTCITSFSFSVFSFVTFSHLSRWSFCCFRNYRITAYPSCHQWTSLLCSRHASDLPLLCSCIDHFQLRVQSVFKRFFSVAILIFFSLYILWTLGLNSCPPCQNQLLPQLN